MDLAIKQSFNNTMLTVKVSDLKLSDYIVDGDKGDRYRELLEMLKDETIVSANQILQGMPGAIDLALQEENQKRSLKDLPLGLLD